MRFTLLVFAAAVAASPFALDKNAAVTSAASKGSAVPSASASRTRHHNHHKEPTPTFKLACNCKKPIIPAGQMNAKEVRGRKKQDW